MKKAISFLLAFLLVIPFFGTVTLNAESLSVSAKSAVLIEAESRTVLYQKNAFLKLPMASTTKIMTALVAIESGNADRLVKTDERACGIEGSSIYLTKGETLTMRELLYALLLSSANDAAVAIAYEVAGSVERFAELMNERAAKMGLTSTHFTNPHGLHDEEHYTTAYDLAVITAEALSNDVFLEICSSKTKKISLNTNDGYRYLTNHNKLLGQYQGCIGVKTGFTKASGRCLVSAAERNGLRLIAVTLSAPNDWQDHKKMLDFGFDNYIRADIAACGEFTALLKVTGGTLDEVVVTNSKDVSLFLPKNHSETVCVAEAIRPLFAPVKRGDTVGRLVCYQDGKEVASSPLVAVTQVDMAKYKFDLKKMIKRLFSK